MSGIIEILNPIHCKASGDLIPHLRDLLSYDYVYWQQGPYSKTRKVTKSFMISAKSGLFLTGLLPKVKKHLKSKNIEFKIIEPKENYNVEPTRKPGVDGIVFRSEQERLIEAAIKRKRGILLASTGSGKTVIAMGIMSAFPDCKILFVCHSLSITTQTISVLKKHGFKVSLVGGGSKDFSGDIVCATIQTLATIDPMEIGTLFETIFIDETHHVNKLNSLYGNFLQSILTPVRFGLTATMPEGIQKNLVLEGLIGPVIEQIKMDEGIKAGFLSKPRIKLIPIEEKESISGLFRYADIYQAGIVTNKERNEKIVKIAKKHRKKGESSLILVKDIEHGLILEELFEGRSLFVRGLTTKEDREKIKNALNDKRIKIVISTAVWREGVDIPSLDVVINACGGKSEIMTLQAIGRGLRTTSTKSKIIVIDFLDPYKYLASHAIKRISIYIANKWI